MRKVFVSFDLGIGVATAPKVGSLSVLSYLHRLICGRVAAEGEIWHSSAETLGISHTADAAFAAGIPMIAVHRDPFERIRSAYEHRVVREKEAPARSFRSFCERLGYYRGFPPIAWHTDPQVMWLGDRPELYAAVLPLSELNLLPHVVNRLTGLPAHEMPWSHRVPSEVPWEEGLKETLHKWVRADLVAGWDGTLSSGQAIG